MTTNIIRCQWCRSDVLANKDECHVCGLTPKSVRMVATASGSHGSYTFSLITGKVLTPLEEMPSEYAQDESIDLTLYTALTGNIVQQGNNVDVLYCDIRITTDKHDCDPCLEPILHGMTEQFADSDANTISVRVMANHVPKALPDESPDSLNRALNKLLPEEPPSPMEYAASPVGVATFEVSCHRGFLNTVLASHRAGVVDLTPEWLDYLQAIYISNMRRNLT